MVVGNADPGPLAGRVIEFGPSETFVSVKALGPESFVTWPLSNRQYPTVAAPAWPNDSKTEAVSKLTKWAVLLVKQCFGSGVFMGGMNSSGLRVYFFVERCKIMASDCGNIRFET